MSTKAEAQAENTRLTDELDRVTQELAEAQAENTRLTDELDRVTQELTEAQAENTRLRNPAPEKSSVPSTCINCGQGQIPIQRTETGYHCLACDHGWTSEHEKAPFRRRE